MTDNIDPDTGHPVGSDEDFAVLIDGVCGEYIAQLSQAFVHGTEGNLAQAAGEALIASGKLHELLMTLVMARQNHMKLIARLSTTVPYTLKPLVAIANAYDDNDLDDEARKFWGTDDNPKVNTTAPEKIELYTGRGGRRLLTLKDCIVARDLDTIIRRLAKMNGPGMVMPTTPTPPEEADHG